MIKVTGSYQKRGGVIAIWMTVSQPGSSEYPLPIGPTKVSEREWERYKRELSEIPWYKLPDRINKDETGTN